MGVHLHTSLLSYTYNAAQDSFLQAGPRESLAPIVNRVPAIWSGLTLGESFLFFPVYNGFFPVKFHIRFWLREVNNRSSYSDVQINVPHLQKTKDKGR